MGMCDRQRNRPGLLQKLACALLLCRLTTAVLAADGSSLRVVVLDPSGAVIVNSTVRVENREQQQAIKTDERGEVLFGHLEPGEYRIHVEAPGFTPRDLEKIIIKPGYNNLQVRLNVADIKEGVVIRQDKRERRTDPRGDAFTTILTEEQIANLPDDSGEMEATLRRMAGPGAVIRVNGFKGGRLPPKSQIRQVRFRRNAYAAEYHEAGLTGVDVLTKPGVDTLHGSLAAAFRGAVLDARNAFAPRRVPEQLRRFEAALDVPVRRDHTSLFVAAEGGSSFDSQTIVAELPAGSLREMVRHPTRSLYTSFKLIDALSKTHTLIITYERNGQRSDNLGVGDFDLPERAYSFDQAESFLRLSETGTFSKRLFNEVRLQARWQESDIHPASDAPAIIVLNTFNKGGAQRQSAGCARELEVADNVDAAAGAHAMRAGVLFEGGWYRNDARPNAGGTFTFASLEDFRAARPTTFTQRIGSNPVEFFQYRQGLYWQDDVRLSQGFTMSLGLRYERQNNLDDRNNFAPRAGFAWSPFKNGRTTIRGGAGIFYDWFGADTFGQILAVNGRKQFDVVVQNPGFPNPLTNSISVELPPSRLQRAAGLSNPYVAQASIGVEREVVRGSYLRASYLYQRGVHLLRGRDVNAPAGGSGRPDPVAGNVIQIEASANSWKHLFNLTLNGVSSRRVYWLVEYLLSSEVTETDGPLSLPADNFNLRGERGPSADDARHRLFANVGLGFFKGVRLATTLSANSGLPYNITTGRDDNRDTVLNDRPAGVARNSARGAAQWDVSMRLSWLMAFGDRKGAAPAQGPRTVVVNGSDVGAIGSELAASEKRWRVNLYLQAYNVFNHANLINYTGVETSPFFRRATAALPGRRVEAGLRFGF